MSARWGLIQHDSEGVGTWVCDRTGGLWYEGCGTAIGFTFDGRMVAGVMYTQWNGANLQMTFASDDSRCINRASIWAAFSYPFLQLRARRVTAVVDCDNVRSLALV